MRQRTATAFAGSGSLQRLGSDGNCQVTHMGDECIGARGCELLASTLMLGVTNGAHPCLAGYLDVGDGVADEAALVGWLIKQRQCLSDHVRIWLHQVGPTRCPSDDRVDQAAEIELVQELRDGALCVVAGDEDGSPGLSARLQERDDSRCRFGFEGALVFAFDASRINCAADSGRHTKCCPAKHG
jgi:hypothetical protein